MKKILTIMFSTALMSSPIIATSNVVSCFGINDNNDNNDFLIPDGPFEDINFILWNEILDYKLWKINELGETILKEIKKLENDKIPKTTVIGQGFEIMASSKVLGCLLELYNQPQFPEENEQIPPISREEAKKVVIEALDLEISGLSKYESTRPIIANQVKKYLETALEKVNEEEKLN